MVNLPKVCILPAVSDSCVEWEFSRASNKLELHIYKTTQHAELLYNLWSWQEIIFIYLSAAQFQSNVYV